MNAAAAQLDWLQEVDTGLPVVTAGNWVRTNYGTGPYQITEVSGPCCCPEYLASLEGDETPSRPHYHITCRDNRGHTCWLNGYTLDGRSVWRRDRLMKVTAGGREA